MAILTELRKLSNDQTIMEVPHWKPNAFYSAMLAGRTYEPKTRPVKILVYDENDMEPETLPPPASKRRASVKKRSPPPKSCSGSDLEDMDMEEHPQPSSSSKAVGLPEPSSSSKPVPVQAADVVAGSSGVSSSGSSSESDSSSSSSSSSASTASACENVAAKPERAARTSNPNQSFAFGLNHVTQVFKDGVAVGWEMQCHHPGHKRGSVKCRKHVKAVTRARDEETTLRMLKTWAAWGATVPTRQAHADLWQQVVAAAGNGTLPEDVAPVLSFRSRRAKAVAKPAAEESGSSKKRRRV